MDSAPEHPQVVRTAAQPGGGISDGIVAQPWRHHHLRARVRVRRARAQPRVIGVPRPLLRGGLSMRAPVCLPGTRGSFTLGPSPSSPRCSDASHCSGARPTVRCARRHGAGWRGGSRRALTRRRAARAWPVHPWPRPLQASDPTLGPGRLSSCAQASTRRYCWQRVRARCRVSAGAPCVPRGTGAPSGETGKRVVC